MRSMKWPAILGSVLLSSSLLFPQASLAAPENGGHGEKNYEVSGFTDHDELTKRLNQIEKNSQGTVAVNIAGYSNQGREIYSARVGSGDKAILIQSEIHGNEKTGTEALLNILQHLGSSQSPEVKELLQTITLVAIPKMNPDASELNRRANDMVWKEVVQDFPQLDSASPSWNYYTRTIQGTDYSERPGFDVNRDFNPELNYTPEAEDFPGSSSEPGFYITPEAQTVRDVYRSLKNEFGKVDTFIDLHHQAPYYYVEGTDDEVTLSLSGQFVADPASEEGEKYEEYEDFYRYDYSKQLNVAAYNALQEMGNSPFSKITLYPQGLDLPGTALGSFALNGSGTVLFEVRGQTHSYGQKKKGQLVKAVETGLNGILESLANGTIDSIDPGSYDEIPKRANEPENE